MIARMLVLGLKLRLCAAFRKRSHACKMLRRNSAVLKTDRAMRSGLESAIALSRH